MTLQAEMLHRIRELVKEEDESVLLIAHDMGVVAAMANKVGVIYAGNVVESAEVVPLFKRSQHP